MKSVNWKVLNIDERAELFAIKIAKLWQVHPFREGNSRTTMTFAAQFAESKNITLDKEIFRKYSDYVRKSLVLSSIGEYSEYKYLTKILKDSMQIGQNEKKDIDLLEKINYKTIRDEIKKVFEAEITDINMISQGDVKILYEFHQKFPDVKAYEDIRKLKKTFEIKATNINPDPTIKLISKALEIIGKLIKKSKSIEKSGISFDRDM